MTEELLPCPCGKVPLALSINANDSSKWGTASCPECGDWQVEFKLTAYPPSLKEGDLRKQAVEAWNAAPRAPDPRLKPPLYAHKDKDGNMCCTEIPWLTCECGDTFTEDALCADCARTEREGLRYHLEQMAEALRDVITYHESNPNDKLLKTILDCPITKARAVLAEYDAQMKGGQK